MWMAQFHYRCCGYKVKIVSVIQQDNLTECEWSDYSLAHWGLLHGRHRKPYRYAITRKQTTLTTSIAQLSNVYTCSLSMLSYLHQIRYIKNCVYNYYYLHSKIINFSSVQGCQLFPLHTTHVKEHHPSCQTVLHITMKMFLWGNVHVTMTSNNHTDSLHLIPQGGWKAWQVKVW